MVVRTSTRIGGARDARRTQEERSAETRRKLIDAAIDFICENGFAAMTTTLVAERAGVSRGALQHQFGARYDLLAAVIDHLSNEISNRTLALADVLPVRSLSFEDRIDAAIKAYWEIYTSNTFLAVLNIFLGVKDDPEQYRPLQRHMVTFYQMNDETWLKLVADSPLPKSQLLAARRVLFGALRGLAIGQVLGTQRTAMGAEFRIFREMFVTVLAPR